MLIINVSKEKNLEVALRKYKFKVQRTKQTEKLREKQQYVKPSVVKRKEKLRAEYKQSRINPED